MNKMCFACHVYLEKHKKSVLCKMENYNKIYRFKDFFWC